MEKLFFEGEGKGIKIELVIRFLIVHISHHTDMSYRKVTYPKDGDKNRYAVLAEQDPTRRGCQTVVSVPLSMWLKENFEAGKRKLKTNKKIS